MPVEESAVQAPNTAEPAAAVTTVEPSSTPTELERNSKFLGYHPEIVATPEETETSGETQEQETVAAEGEGETAEPAEEDDPNWLPSEQQKVFPSDVIAKYAKRYGYTAEEVEADPRIATFLHDKINSDVFIAAQKAAEEAESETEPTGEEEEEPVVQAAPLAPTEARKQYYEQVSKFVDTAIDQESIKQLGINVLKDLGVDIASKDPAVKEYLERAPQLGRTLATSAVDLVNTMLPAVLPNMLDATFPGFREMYETALYARSWDSVRGSDPALQELPDYGTREFTKAARAAAAKYPGFDAMVFTGSDGRALPTAQQAQMKYQMLAAAMTGQKVDPAVVQQAVETGKKLERKTNDKRQAGQALGSGRSKGQLTKETNDVNAEMIAAYNARNGSAFGHK